MQNNGGLRLAGPALGVALLLGACASQSPPMETTAASDPDINTRPANYKAEILAGMRVYLNDPTGIREAGIAEPALKTVGGLPRYVVCLRFDAKKHGREYAGTKEIAAVFIVGRFDRFLDKAQEQCAGATYSPFPELQKLSR
jgi:hypothetical protein